jgi:hypothetical protein
LHTSSVLQKRPITITTEAVAIPTQGLNRPIAAIPTQGLNRPVAAIPTQGLNRPIAAIPTQGLNRPAAAIPTQGLNRPVTIPSTITTSVCSYIGIVGVISEWILSVSKWVI